MSSIKCRFCMAGSKYQTVKGKHVYGASSHYKFMECAKCHMVYLYPSISDRQEKMFYKKEFEKFMENRSGVDTKKGWKSPEEHIKSNQQEVNRRMKFLKKYVTGKPLNILEVGCSSGFMLLELKRLNHKVYGIEMSGAFENFLKSRDVYVYSNIKEILNLNIKFDLIIHYYVLEHIRNPVAFLKVYTNLLSKKGTMIFEVPNVKDPLISLYKNQAFDKFYWSIAHHWYFSPASIENMLNKLHCRYTIHYEQRYDLSNHIVWMNEGKSGGKERYSKIFSRSLDKQYKDDLIKKRLCDTLLIEINNRGSK